MWSFGRGSTVPYKSPRRISSTLWRWNKTVEIYTAFWNEFSQTKMFELWFKFNWSLFLRTQLATKQIWLPPFFEYTQLPHDYHLHIISQIWQYFCQSHDMDHSQKLLYTTHLITMTNICIKHEKDPSSGKKVTERTCFCCPILWQSHEQMTLNWRYGSKSKFSWWHHKMETLSALLAICAGNSPVPGEFPTQRPVMRSFDVFFDLRPNKRLSKQWWGWWFEMPSCPLWCHCNVTHDTPPLSGEYI